MNNKRNIDGLNTMNKTEFVESQIDFDALILKLKKDDSRYIKRVKYSKSIFIASAIFLLPLNIITPYFEFGLHNIILSICFSLAFLCAGFIIWQYYKKLIEIDYSQTVIQMLLSAIKRHRSPIYKIVALIPSAIFIDIGVSFFEYFKPNSVDPLENIIKFQVFFIIVISVHLLREYIIWFKNQRPLQIDLVKMLKELENLK